MGISSWLRERRIKRDRLDQLTEEILKLKEAKKDLELTVKHQKQEVELAERDRQDKWSRERETYQRQIQHQKEDAERTLKVAKEDAERILKNKIEEHEQKLTETTALTKLEKEQEMAQLKLDYDTKLKDLQTQHSRERASQESELATKYYDMMKEELRKLNAEGNITTKTIQEITMKMLDRAGDLNVHKTEARLITQP